MPFARLPWRRLLAVMLTGLLGLATYWFLPMDLPEPGRRAAAIFVVAAVFWATELLPLFATSLCVIGFEILFLASRGGLADKLPRRSVWPDDAAGEPMQLSFSLFLEPFSSAIIILFMGGFLLSAAVSKHGLDRLMAGRLLRPVSGSPRGMIWAVLLITAFFSMWMSNTATTAMMLAIATPLLLLNGIGDRFKRSIVLAVPIGANVGGMGTPIGTPPNAVALAALRQQGFTVTFLEWMVMAVPMVIVLLGLAGVLLTRGVKPASEGVRFEIDAPSRRMTWRGRLTMLIVVAAIGLWLTGGLHGLHSAVVALLAAAALTALGVLDRNDVDSIDWDVLLLMWGGLSLGVTMEATGLVDYIVALRPEELTGWALVVGVVVLSLLLSTFMSNTAAANLLIPTAMAMAATRPEAGRLAVICALACASAMAMPVSTPPNAMAFATGRISAAALIRVGTVMSAVAGVLLLILYGTLLPAMRGLGG